MTEFWQTRLTTDADQEIASEILFAAFDALSIDFSRQQDDRPWDVLIISETPPDRERWMVAERELANLSGSGMSEPVTNPLPAIDWLARNHEDLPPLDIGRFWIYGSHVTARAPAGKIPVRIDANQAFGTGGHGTTRGCLEMLERYLPGRQCKVADIGAGSGILAIAAAKRNPEARVIAADNDPVAVAVMRENIALNGVEGKVLPVLSMGYAAEAVQASAPYDVIMANILPGPLMEMASGAAAALASDGVLVLSGLMSSHHDAVVEAHRATGLQLEGSLIMDDWVTLAMRREEAKTDDRTR